MKSIWQLYQKLLKALPSEARRFLIGYSASLGMLSILDAAALALLAITIGPIVNGTDLSLPILGEVTGAGLIALLGAVCLLIVLKGLVAVALLWRATRRFAGYELELGARLFRSYLGASWTERLKKNSSDLVRLLDGSVSLAVNAFLLPGSTLLGEALSFVTVIAVLAVAQPVIAVIALAYLGLLGAFLYFWVTRRSRQAGAVNLRYSLSSSRLITEMIGALKEVTLRNKLDEVSEVVRENRRHATRARSNAIFLGQVPRYVLESGLVGGFVIVGIAGFLMDGIAGATTAVALFALAGFRIAPSVVRFQSILSQMTVATPHAEAVLEEIRSSEAGVSHLADRPALPLPDEPATLTLNRVGFRYAPDLPEVIRDVDVEIRFGSSVAFVGSSGAGKSTIIDLILGLIEPTAGDIAIDGTSLSDVTTAWRGRVGYVPQEVSLFDATIAQNVALSWRGGIDEDRVIDSLKRAQLLDFVMGRDGGIHARVGERGLSLSGGQRQRLGIARALYSDPLVLVMDEATSALDTATEAAVSASIRALHGSLTVITVAHRLATVLDADRIFFMRNGLVAAQGTFDELVAVEPEFANQARLAGLTGDATDGR